MNKEMYAAIYEGTDRLALSRVPIPEPDDDGALIRVKACAICGSDIRILHHGHKRVKPPQILGHEYSGEVVKIGKNVTKLKVGDRVSCCCDIPCGYCENCAEGWFAYCKNPVAFGHELAGGLAEYCLLPGHTINMGTIHHIPKEVSYDEAALAEPLGCLLNGMERACVRVGDQAVVIGAGPIGCLMVPVLNMLGASKVILIQRSKPRLELAKKIISADSYICSNEEDAVEAVMRETNGRGADLVFTANPSPSSHSDAVKMAGIHARVCIFGGMASGTVVPDFDTNAIHYKELNVFGAHASNPRHHALALRLMASGRIDVKPFISCVYPLEQVSEAFRETESHTGMRIIVKP